MDNLTKLLKESFEYQMTDVHTAMPAVVVKYDPKTRRADVQPSLKRKMPGDEYMDFPIIPEVPVMFFGTKKFTIHVPPERDDEVLLVFSERGTDAWKAGGGDGIKEADPRRFNLQDCFALPGLQAKGFIPVEEKGLNIVHKTKPDGELVSRVTMDDDGIVLQHRENARGVFQDDHITLKTDKCTTEMQGEKIVFTNGRNTFQLDDAIRLVTSGTGTLEIGNSVDALGGILAELCDIIATLGTIGSPGAQKANPVTIAKAEALAVIVGKVFG